MDRIIPAFVALAGLATIVLNRRFGRAAITNSREVFGRDIRKDSREYRFAIVFSRSLAVVGGTGMLILGTLDALLIDWRAHISATGGQDVDPVEAPQSPIGRLVFALVALGGIAVAAASGRLARAVLRSNLEFLGRSIAEESSRYRTLLVLTRLLVIATGGSLLVVGAMYVMKG